MIEWKEVSGYPHMLRMERSDQEGNGAIAFVLVCEVPADKGWKQVFRGGYFSFNANINDPIVIATKLNPATGRQNANFRSFHEVCRVIESRLKVRNERGLEVTDENKKSDILGDLQEELAALRG